MPKTSTTTKTKATVCFLRQEKVPGDAYRAFFGELFHVHFQPVLAFETMVTATELHNMVIDHANDYIGMVVTSARAFKTMSLLLSADALSTAQGLWHHKMLFVVGAETLAACPMCFEKVLVGTGTAKELLLTVEQHYIHYDIDTTNSSMLPKKLLFLCGNLSADDLLNTQHPSQSTQTEDSKDGRHVVPFIEKQCIYKTVPAPTSLDFIQTIQSLDPIGPYWIVFFSPSGVSFFYDKVYPFILEKQQQRVLELKEGGQQNSWKNIKYAAIGSTTAKAMEHIFHHSAHAIASQPTAAALFESIQMAE